MIQLSRKLILLSLVFSTQIGFAAPKQFECPQPQQIKETPVGDNKYVWKGPNEASFIAWASTPENAPAPLAAANNVSLVYLANPGFYHIICYYPTAQSTPNLPNHEGDAVYTFGSSDVKPTACRQTGPRRVICD